jgi:hypothetical protein
MREIRQSGSEGGAAQANALLLPLSQGIVAAGEKACRNEDLHGVLRLHRFRR